MAEINNTVPSIVRGSSLYEAMYKVAEIANKAIDDADTANKDVTEAKAAAAAAQQTANQAHEEAINAANSAEQAGEKAQAAQTAADGAQTAAGKAQTTADSAVSKNTQQDTRIDDIESGKTIIPTYFKTTTRGNAVPVMSSDGTEIRYLTAIGSIQGDVPVRRRDIDGTADGGVLVPRTPLNRDEAASKDYVDTAVATVAAAPNTSLTGKNVPADENGTAISQISVERIGISGFSGTLKKISYLDINGEIATKYDENPSKKLSFDITGVLGDGGNPGALGKIPINVFSGTETRFTFAEFSASTGKMVIDCSQFDPAGGKTWKVFGQHIYYKS